MPKISVIVPVYKAEGFLRQCTQSILTQSFADFELILVEDGSPDGSGALCDTIAQEDYRVRVIHQENGGVSVARNRGMDEARGRFISFVDADDWLAEGALEELYQLVMDGDADTAGCAHFKAEPDGSTVVEQGVLPSGVYGPKEIREGIVYPLVGDRLGKPEQLLNGFIWRFLFNRQLIEQCGLRFSGAYLEDELFLVEYFCQAKRLVMSDKPLYYYLQNPQSVTRQYLPEYLKTFSTFMKAKEALVKRFDLEDARPQWKQNSNWSGLLIAVGNEYAPGNSVSLRQKNRRVKRMANRPEMKHAIQTINPKGLGRNKQMVADLLSKRAYWLLGLLYTVKNRNR